MMMTRIVRATVWGGMLAASLALAACGSQPTAGYNGTQFAARLWSGSEVPANPSPATGNLSASFNKATSTLNWSIRYDGLSGPVTAAHFHGPAGPGMNAGPTVPIPNDKLASPITGSAVLTPQQAADLLAGRWYFNVHTAANPGGEIRGQVIAQM